MVLGMSSNPGTGGGTTGGISHWGAWAIEESTIKLHVEPMLDVIVNALTMGYLRPAVDGSLAVVTYDTTKLRLRPDRSKEAIELWDRGLISNEVVLRENGFTPADSPEAEEFKTWLLRKMAGGSTTPEQVQAAARELGVDLGIDPIPTTRRESVTEPQIPRQERPAPSLDQHPTKPRTPAEAASLLLAAAEPLVFRALERAGNRLRQSGSRPPNVPAYETHVYVKANGKATACLDDAWSCAPHTLEGNCDDPVQVIEVLNAYCLALLNEGSPHSRDRLRQWLELGSTC